MWKFSGPEVFLKTCVVMKFVDDDDDDNDEILQKTSSNKNYILGSAANTK